MNQLFAVQESFCDFRPDFADQPYNCEDIKVFPVNEDLNRLLRRRRNRILEKMLKPDLLSTNFIYSMEVLEEGNYLKLVDQTIEPGLMYLP